MPISSETFAALSRLSVGDIVIFSKFFRQSLYQTRVVVLKVIYDESGRSIILSQLSASPSHIPFMEGGMPVKWKVSLDFGFSSSSYGRPFPIRVFDFVDVSVEKPDPKIGSEFVSQYQKDTFALEAFMCA